MASQTKKTKKTSKKSTLILFLVILGLIILGDIAIYFFYYVPRTRTSAVFFGSVESDLLEAPGFLIKLTLSEEPEGIVVDTIDFNKDILFSVESMTYTTISTPISEEISSDIVGSPKYISRRFVPTNISVSFSIPEDAKLPKGLFTYHEPPYLGDMYALLAAQGYDIVEVVPFYWKSRSDLKQFTRMLIFPDASRDLTNQTVYIEYTHLIGKGLIEGDNVKKMRVISLNDKIISFIDRNYQKREPLILSVSNASYITNRANIFHYYMSYS